MSDEADEESAHEEGEEDEVLDHPRARGGCMTAFLGVLFLLSFVAAGGDLTMRRVRMMSAPALVAPNLGYLLLALAHLLEPAFLYGIFRWKRWGVYGFFAVHAAFVVLSLWVGEGMGRTLLLGLLPPALLVFLIRRIGGEHFE